MFFIISKLKFILGKSFVRNILMLVSGTALAQVINIVFYPLITRLYGPESFGGLGYYIALLGFLIPLSAFCYPLALVLPKRDTEAIALLDISIKISLVITVLISIFLFFIDFYVHDFFPFSGSYYLVPVGVLLSSFVLIYTQIAIRYRRYKLISILTIFISIFGGFIKVGFGYFISNSLVLILISLILILINLLLLMFFLKVKFDFLNLLVFRKRNFYIFVKYIRFPLFRLPHSLMAVISQVAPVFLLTFFFGAKYAGYFVLTRTILSAPVVLVGKAIYDVSFPKINYNYNHGIENYNFILYVTSALALLSLFPLIVIFLFGDFIFSKVFGDIWAVSGVYATWMSVWFAFNIFNKAAAAAVSVYGLDAFLFRNGMVNITLSIAGFLVGALYFESDVVAVALFSLLGVFSQVNLILQVLLCVKKKDFSLINIRASVNE